MASFLAGPAPPRVREDALTASYAVRRDAGHGAVLVRRSPSPEVQLAASTRRRGVDWNVISQALLADALDAEPQRRLVSDYARFLVIARNGERVVGGAQLQAWLDTWRPSILGVFAGR